MSSNSNTAPGSKSTKFVAANPLDPMLRPFDSNGMNDDDRNIQQEMANSVNQRLEKAVEELKEKHRTGRNEVDDPDRAPTGPTYKAMRAAQQLQKQQIVRETEQQLEKIQITDDGGDVGDDDDDDDEFDDLLDDPALDELRDRRLGQMKQAHDQKLEHLGKGHGQYRMITQDEFLPECNTDSSVVVHFCHESFERCKIMDEHLKQLCVQYLECKFVRILAEKAPFFVEKLQVRTLPTLLVFKQGKLVDRLTGFQGLTPDSVDIHNTDKAKEDQFETWRLAKWIADHTGAFQYRGPVGEERESMMEQKAANRKGAIYRGGVNRYNLDDE